MNKPAILLSLCLAIGVVSPVASQVPVQKIAYDSCYYDYWNYYYTCYITVANPDGTGATYVPAEAMEPAWSPDGSRIAFTDLWGSGVYFWNSVDGSVTALEGNYYGASSPTWAPDGQHIAFSSARTGTSELFAWQAADGSVTQLTHGAGVIGAPAWSPDGTRIAFDCQIVPGNIDICALELATGVVARLTTDPASDSGPAWSPDGTRLAFATTRFGFLSGEIAVMNADGTAVSRLGSGIEGRLPSWSPGGNRIAYQTSTGGYCDDYGFCTDVIFLVNVDGTGQTFFGFGFNAAWAASSTIGRPHARISYSCNSLTCSFSGQYSSDDDGQISGFTWDFGDGGSGTGGTIDHTFSAAGTYSVTLTVVDNDGREGTTTLAVPVVILPHAVATVSCSGLTCTFDGSASSDPDGTIADYTWSFGDGQQGSGAIVSHTYATGNTYYSWLRVTDNTGGVSVTYSSVVVRAPVHVGDLDGSATSLRDKWTAGVTISVHDPNHQAVAYVTVNGTWNSGVSGTCTTNGVGQCTVFLYELKRSIGEVTFTVGSLELFYVAYNPAANHDPDGDSNGTAITVRRH